MNPSKYLLTGAREYSIYVCQNRAIPDVRDGFKASQRISLWCLRNSTSKMKTAALAGEMIASSLYVHGDTSAADAISNMAAPYINNETIFTGRGAFGTLVDPRAIGAGRYTYVSVSKYTRENILVDSNLYNMVPSVDGDNVICDSFLPIIPNVLLNGTTGLAVGWSTAILPHKLDDLKKATVNAIQGNPIGHIMPHWNHYDIDIKRVENDKDDSESYETSGRVKIHNTTTVEITSIPPNMDMDKIQTHLENLIENKKITAYENHTSVEFSILIKMTRTELEGKNESQLIKLFKLNTKLTERLVTVGFDGKSIRTFNNTADLINEWTKWRLGFYLKRYEFFLNKNNVELNFLRNVIKCFDGNIPEKLKGFKSKVDLSSAIESICGKEEPKIVEFPSYKWTLEEKQKFIDRIEFLIDDNKEHQKMIDSEDKRKKQFIKEVLA